MAKTKSTAAPADKRTAVVRIARPADRPYYIWYRCPETNERFRLSTGTRDEAEAEEMRADLEAKVRLGLTRFKRSKVPGDQMSWEEFRWEYTNKRLSTLKPGSAARPDKRNKCATVVVPDPGSVARQQPDPHRRQEGRRGEFARRVHKSQVRSKCGNQTSMSPDSMRSSTFRMLQLQWRTRLT